MSYHDKHDITHWRSFISHNSSKNSWLSTNWTIKHIFFQFAPFWNIKVRVSCAVENRYHDTPARGRSRGGEGRGEVGETETEENNLIWSVAVLAGVCPDNGLGEITLINHTPSKYWRIKSSPDIQPHLTALFALILVHNSPVVKCNKNLPNSSEISIK